MVIELKNDNLIDFFVDEKVIVVFSSEHCKACKELKPYLYKIPDEYKVVIVDAERHIRSSKFMPGGVKYYPTIAYFERGYYKTEFNQLELMNIKDQL